MWFYTLNGENFGPISEADLDARIASGALPPSVNVWREGMESWVPLNQLRAPAPSVPRISVPPAVAAAPPYADPTPARFSPAYESPLVASSGSRMESFGSWGKVVVLFIAMFAFIGVLASRPHNVRASGGAPQSALDETEESFNVTAHIESDNLVIENKSGFDWPSATIQFRSGGFRYIHRVDAVPRAGKATVALGDFVNSRGAKFTANRATRKPTNLNIQVPEHGSATVALGTTL